MTDLTHRASLPIYISPAFLGEALDQRLRRLWNEYHDAEWLDAHPKHLAFIKSQIEMTQFKLSIGETHDLPF